MQLRGLSHYIAGLRLMWVSAVVRAKELARSELDVVSEKGDEHTLAVDAALHAVASEAGRIESMMPAGSRVIVFRAPDRKDWLVARSRNGSHVGFLHRDELARVPAARAPARPGPSVLEGSAK